MVGMNGSVAVMDSLKKVFEIHYSPSVQDQVVEPFVFGHGISLYILCSLRNPFL